MERRADPPISKLMTKILHTSSEEDLIDKVAADMNRFHVYALPVVSADGRIFGIITANDLSRFQAAKKNPKTVRAWELCSYKPLRVSPDTPTTDVAKLMLTHHVHHILVSNEDNLYGIVSTFDFVQQYVLSRQT